ncbi:hypothetical protein KY310_02165 [Candidatus Woesearchaeota archaeon]|nr:hypothetical protein [Candidatus Woesearchaeota archaeon]
MVKIDKVDLIHKFVQTYNSAQDSIDDNRMDEAKQKYKELMSVYKQISDSDMESVHKELAYDQVMKVFNGVKGMKPKSSIHVKSIAAAVVIIIISLVIFIKPEIIGMVTFDVNQAPVWTGDGNLFVITGVPKESMFIGNSDRTVNLAAFFSDPNGDELTYLATSTDGLDVKVSGSYISFIPQPGVFGERVITVVASDGTEVVQQDLLVRIVKR